MSTATRKRIARIEEAIASIVPLGDDYDDAQAFYDALFYRANNGLWHGVPALTTFIDWVRSGELTREAQRRGLIVPEVQDVL